MKNYGAIIPIFTSLFERTAFVLSCYGVRYLVTGYYHSYNDKYESKLLLDDKFTEIALKPVIEDTGEISVSVFECPVELESVPVLYPANTDLKFYNSEVNVYYGARVTYAGHMSYSYFRQRRDGSSDHLDINRVKGSITPYPMVRSGIISGMDSMVNPHVFYLSTGFQVSRYYAGGPVLNDSGMVIGVLGDYQISTTKDPYYLDENDEDKFTIVHAMGPIMSQLESL